MLLYTACIRAVLVGRVTVFTPAGEFEHVGMLASSEVLRLAIDQTEFVPPTSQATLWRITELAFPFLISDVMPYLE
jgi:hypothetical protein